MYFCIPVARTRSVVESSNTTEIISTTLNYTTNNYLHSTHSDFYQRSVQSHDSVT